MVENNENNVQTENVVAPSPEEVLADLKANYVPKEREDYWHNKYNQIFAEVANGTFSVEDNKESTKSEEDARINFENNLKLAASNDSVRPLSLFKAAVEADDYLVSQGKRSVFAASEGDLSDSDTQSCERMNALLKDVIDKSENDDNVALAYLGTKLVDAVKIPTNRR